MRRKDGRPPCREVLKNLNEVPPAATPLLAAHHHDPGENQHGAKDEAPIEGLGTSLLREKTPGLLPGLLATTDGKGRVGPQGRIMKRPPELAQFATGAGTQRRS